jgi:hypothetical protein
MNLSDGDRNFPASFTQRLDGEVAGCRVHDGLAVTGTNGIRRA